MENPQTNEIEDDIFIHNQHSSNSFIDSLILQESYEQFVFTVESIIYSNLPLIKLPALNALDLLITLAVIPGRENKINKTYKLDKKARPLKDQELSSRCFKIINEMVYLAYEEENENENENENRKKVIKLDNPTVENLRKVIKRLFCFFYKHQRYKNAAISVDNTSTNRKIPSLLYLRNKISNPWKMIAWSFRCGASKNLLILERWNIWMKMLEICLTILEKDWDICFKQSNLIGKSKQLQQSILQSALIIKMQSTIESRWESECVRFIFASSDTGNSSRFEPIYDNEIDNLQILEKRETTIWLGKQTMSLRKRYIELIWKATNTFKHRQYSSKKFLEEICFQLKTHMIPFEELIEFFSFDATHSLTKQWIEQWIEIYGKIAVELLSDPLKDTSWLYDPDVEHICGLLKSVPKRMDQSSFGSKCVQFSFLLSVLFNVWNIASRGHKSDKQRQQLKQAIDEGTRRRLQLLEGKSEDAAVEHMSQIRFLMGRTYSRT